MDNDKLDSLAQLQEVLKAFELEWPDLTSEDCIPLDVALPFTDANSDQSYKDYRELKAKLKQSLKRAVNENYMAFNDSIGSYGISIETLNQSQNSLTGIRENLSNVDKLLSSESGIMHELNEKRNEKIQVLDILEKISNIQKKLKDTQIKTENLEFDKAVSLVQEITEVINDNQLFDIEGLHALKTKLNSSLAALLDGLLNEIDNNIYSKNSNRLITFNNSCTRRIPAEKGLLGFLKKLNGNMIDEDEELAVRNSRFDDLRSTFRRVQKIGKQSECLSRLVGSFEREMKRVIKRSVDEIRQKYPSQIEMNAASHLDKNADPFESFNMLQGINGIVINDFFDLIFARTLALMQKHIAIYEISKIDGYKYRIDVIWREVQKQLSMIMFNYIIDENLLNNIEEHDMKHSRQQNETPFDKVLKQFERVDNGPVFQFSKLSLESLSVSLVDSLNGIFQGNDKGINPNEFTNQNVGAAQMYIGMDDINESKKHVLVKPNIFNMGYIIESFITFINDLTLSFGDDSDGVVEFFEEFMDVVFVSQLENTLVYQFDKLCEEKWVPTQLLEASNHIKLFFNKVFVLLDTSLYYRPSYVEIIGRIFDRMIENFKHSKESLLKIKDNKILAKWVSDLKLNGLSNSIVDILLQNPNDYKRLDLLISNELVYALSVAGNFIPTINPNNFLTLNHMRSLVDLLAALLNIINWMPSLKVKVPDFLEKVELLQKLKETWSLTVFRDSDFPLRLVNLSSETNYNEGELNNDKIVVYSGGAENEVTGFMALDLRAEERFDKLIDNMRLMMNSVEILIRYEIRIECIWYMIQMMISKQWEQVGDESVDLGIDKFCERINNINRIFNKFSKNIGNKSRDEAKIRIFGGLGFWIDKLAIFESRRISVMGGNGWMKMIVNLKVLQQVILSIDSDIITGIEPGVSKMNTSLRYFAIGSEGERFLKRVDQINKENLNIGEEDWKNLVRLIFSEKLAKDSVGNYKKKFMAAQAGLLKALSVK